MLAAAGKGVQVMSREHRAPGHYIHLGAKQVIIREEALAVRLEKLALQNETTVADFAAASARGTSHLRPLVSPLLPTLYTFVARRAQDIEEAEDLLVETLLLARESAPSHRAARAPLLPWLLQLADRILRARIGVSPLLEAGLEPNLTVFKAQATPELLEAIAGLPADRRRVLGMRFGDGLSEEVIGQVLGTDTRTAASLVERAVEALGASWSAHERAFRVRPESWGVMAALAPFLATAAPTSAQEVRVWQRFDDEEEREEFRPARPLTLPLPRWARSVLGGVGLLIAVASLWLWTRGGSAGTPSSADTAAQQPAAAPAVSRVVFPTSGPMEPSTAGQGIPPQAAGMVASGRTGWRHDGRLYYVEYGAYIGAALMVTGPDASTSEREPDTRALAVRYDPGDRFVYSVSPSGSEVLVGGKEGVFLHRGDGDSPRKLPNVAVSTTRHGISGPDALVWHPNARQFVLALETFAPGRRPARHSSIRVVQLNPDGRGSGGVESVREIGRVDGAVSSLSYSPTGRYLLLNLQNSPALLIDTGRNNKVVRLPAVVQRAQWSPSARPNRLLWSGYARQPHEVSFGTVGPDGKGLRRIGTAAFAGWHPDGRRIIASTAMSDSQPGRGFTFWRVDPGRREWEKLSDVPDMVAPLTPVAWGPDGGHLAYGVGDGLYLVHYGNRGRVEKVSSLPQTVTSVQWQDEDSRSTASPGPETSPYVPRPGSR